MKVETKEWASKNAELVAKVFLNETLCVRDMHSVGVDGLSIFSDSKLYIKLRYGKVPTLCETRF